MAEEIPRRLQELLNLFPDLLENERRLKATLKDYFPRDKLLQNLLYMTAESGLLQNASAAGRVDKFSMHGYVKCLTDDYGISGRVAKKAIIMWLTALKLPYEDIVIEDVAPRKKGPVIRVPEPKEEPPDPMAEEREENRRLEEIVKDYNTLLSAKLEELEERSTNCCFQHNVKRFHVSTTKFWVSEIKKQPGSQEWWTVCWKRSRYWAFPFAASKYAVFPNPKLIFDGYMHTVPRLYEFFTMIVDSDDYVRYKKIEPAIFTARNDVWKKFSNGILYG